MTEYLVLMKLTAKGAENVKGLPQRAQQSRTEWEAAGIRVKSSYLAMGRYDMVLLLEAPDDETLARALLAMASRGNVTTETLRLFNREQTQAILSALS